jgi:hypothetical protein
MPAIAWVLVIIIGLALLPQFSKQVETTLKQVVGSVAGGAEGVAINYYVVTGVVAAVLGITTVVVVSAVSKKQGSGPVKPEVAPIGIAAPPKLATGTAIKVAGLETGAHFGG